MSLAFWATQCHKRGPGLSHAHSSDCTKNHTPIHMSDQCCDCGERASSWVEPKAAPPEEAQPDHRYVFTMSGGCALARCGRPEAVHPIYMKTEDGECPVSHDSLRAKRLIGDGGWVWSLCPQCGVMVEPRHATGVLAGATWGIGRGWVNPRMRRRWTAIAKRFESPGPDDQAIPA